MIGISSTTHSVEWMLSDDLFLSTGDAPKTHVNEIILGTVMAYGAFWYVLYIRIILPTVVYDDENKKR
jgi:hypothetical protein